MLNQQLSRLCLEEGKGLHVVKSIERQKGQGEVFTPTELVLEMVAELPQEYWEEGKTFLDPTCGNGQFLAVVAIIKRELGHTSVLDSIYGVDLMPDNVEECRARLLAIAGDTPENRAILENNILCKDGLEYDYSFGTSPQENLFDW